MIREILDDLFGRELLDAHPDEWGICAYCDHPSAMGYATTITPEAIGKAVDLNVDLIVTHHDAWDFMFEQCEEVQSLLKENGLTHVWAHLPLDLADFGTSATLLSEMGCAPVAVLQHAGGRVGERPEFAPLGALRERLTTLMSEQPCRVYDAGRAVRRVATVTGAGFYTNFLRDALSYDVDLYVTGETSLFLLEYAKFRKVNVLVYSHNYTELPGVRAFAERIAGALGLDMKGHLGDSHW
ncbi:MAG: Nif3-like dinuclear metal center hexameric protein [Gemmatimonadota bacterium]|nr:Nif3-like dinuclear metal center hexameric protein [Gemmatimonadota bacterium]